MAVIKSWEATEVYYDDIIQMWIDGNSVLHVRRGYNFLDVEGNKFVPSNRYHEEEVPWAEVPVDIQNSLTQINDYINAKIKEKEGITEEPII